MILANTKATGYSLGLPLFWPEHPEQLSTGLLKGVSITLCPDDSVKTYPDMLELFITKYSISSGRISLTIANTAGIICSLDAQLNTYYTVYPLEGASPWFLGGWVSLYPPTTDGNINLIGAQINPLYIYLCKQQTYTPSYFTLYKETLVSGAVCGTAEATGGDVTIASAVLSSIPIASLTVQDTADVKFGSTWTSGALAVSGAAATAVTSAQPVDSTSIYYINGNPISAGGSYVITLPEGWVVSGAHVVDGVTLCAQIGCTRTTPSCPSTDPIVDILGPQNFAGSNPLHFAFSAIGGTYKFNSTAVESARFNAEYEDGGLRWCEFSSQHDAGFSGGCVTSAVPAMGSDGGTHDIIREGNNAD